MSLRIGLTKDYQGYIEVEGTQFGIPIPKYTNSTRPAAGSVGATPDSAIMIWNSDDNAPNFSDGNNWYDAAGNIIPTT